MFIKLTVATTEKTRSANIRQNCKLKSNKEIIFSFKARNSCLYKRRMYSRAYENKKQKKTKETEVSKRKLYYKGILNIKYTSFAFIQNYSEIFTVTFFLYIFEK